MDIWDRGTYEAEKFRENEVIAVFNGERVKGKYALFQTRGDDWMIHRMDPPEDPDYEPFPDRIAPMKAKTGGLPRNEDAWGYEAGGRDPGGHVRRPRPHDPPGPQLQRLHAALSGAARAARGLAPRASCSTARSWRSTRRAAELRAAPVAHAPGVRLRGAASDARHLATYVIFDLLYLDGHTTTGLTYEERRSLLRELDLNGPLGTPAHHEGDGEALLDATKELGVEGIVAKKLDSAYEPGRRSSCWIKIKNVSTQDVVIGGYAPGEGKRRGRVGALAVGYYEDGSLRYAGKVGTGFTEQTLGILGGAHLARARGQPLRRPPAAQGDDLRGAAPRGPGGVPRVDEERHPEGAIVQGPAARRGPLRGGREPQVSAR